MFLKRTLFQKIRLRQVTVLVVSVSVGVGSDNLSGRAMSNMSALGSWSSSVLV